MTKRIRILLISNPRSSHALNWVNGLVSANAEVDVLFVTSKLKEGVTKEEFKVDAHLLLEKTGKSLFIQSLKQLSFGCIIRDLKNRTTVNQRFKALGKQLDKFLKSSKYDIVHAHGLTAASLLVSNSSFRPYTISIFGSDIFIHPQKNPYLVRLMKRALNSASFIHVQGNAALMKVKEMAPEVTDKILMKTWGADTSVFTPNKQRSSLEKYQLPAGKWILSFRALYPLYRIDSIIKTFHQLSSVNNEISLMIGGNGPEKQKLENLAQELGISHRVFFMGYLEPEEMAELFAASYLYIQFPESDGTSITVMEAMSSGLPIISSKVGDIGVLVADGKNGFLVEDSSLEPLAEKVQYLLDNELERKLMSGMSREIAIEHHDKNRFFLYLLQNMRDTIDSS